MKKTLKDRLKIPQGTPPKGLIGTLLKVVELKVRFAFARALKVILPMTGMDNKKQSRLILSVLAGEKRKP